MASQHITTDIVRRPAGQIGLRPGVTLIELLVVITIMLIITAAAIPTFAPSMANRRIREAARQTSSFISGARARAIEKGRPVGVQIEAAAGVPGASLLLTYVESPPPYCGDTTSATLQFNANAGGNSWQVTPFPSSDPLLNMVKVGDLLRLGYQGHMFRIDGLSGSPPNIWTLSSETVPPASMGGILNANHPPLPYQIFRQPVRSSAAPLQLPESMVIDISASGVGGSGLFSLVSPTTGGAPVVITFAPTGSVTSISIGGGPPQRPTAPIFLLIGQRAKLPAANYSSSTAPDALTAAKLFNFRDPQNLWVSINPSSGLVTTSPVAVVNGSSGDFAADVAASRSLARDAQTLGGN